MDWYLNIAIVMAVLSGGVLIFHDEVSQWDYTLVNKMLSKITPYIPNYLKIQIRPNQKKNCLKPKEILFSKSQLAKYVGGKKSPGLYLAFLGIVYDVEKGKQHYEPGKSYAHFAGKDATRAYVTGDFTPKELKEDLTGLEVERFEEVKKWMELYEKDYRRVGKLIGAYYDATGCETKALKWVHKRLKLFKEMKIKDDEDSKIFPGCNSQWNAETGGRVSCSRESGGIDRDWVGVPRRLFMAEKKRHRCACVKNFGPPTVSGAVKDGYAENMGDLGNPRLKEYANCEPASHSCPLPG